MPLFRFFNTLATDSKVLNQPNNCLAESTRDGSRIAGFHSYRAAGRSLGASRLADDVAVGLQVKMVAPFIFAWIEKINAITRRRINAGEVTRFVKIALCAAPRQVVELIFTAMHESDDMIDMERPLVCRLRKTAVFAAPVCPLSHTLSRPCVHDLARMPP
jgi:hypothetical protein